MSDYEPRNNKEYRKSKRILVYVDDPRVKEHLKKQAEKKNISISKECARRLAESVMIDVDFT